MADRIALMREGRIVQLGHPVDLYYLPEDGFVAGFFGDINHLEGVVERGSVKTPFGVVAAEGIGDGTEVEILIRPEALRLEAPDQKSDGQENLARVMASRMLGRTSLVHLAPLGWEEHEHHLHARIPGRFLPPEDELFRVSLDHSQTFVFPRRKTT